MPIMLKFGALHSEVPVATEEELLEFANKLRAAGAADPLDALMPSMPGDAERCLIANACNFGCTVNGDGPVGGEKNEIQWVLEFPEGMDEDRARRVAEAVALTLDVEDSEFTEGLRFMSMKLPREIGNAAHAFDHRVDWTAKYGEEVA